MRIKKGTGIARPFFLLAVVVAAAVIAAAVVSPLTSLKEIFYAVNLSSSARLVSTNSCGRR
jgi:hypothetical protein